MLCAIRMYGIPTDLIPRLLTCSAVLYGGHLGSLKLRQLHEASHPPLSGTNTTS